MVLKLTLYGDPRTKKNHQRICVIGKRRFVMPSKQYTEYETACLYQIPKQETPIDYPVNVKCVYYMKTRRKVDLVNLQESILDILVRAGVLADDNSNIVASQDGSKVLYDKENPRAEIEITEKEVIANA